MVDRNRPFRVSILLSSGLGGWQVKWVGCISLSVSNKLKKMDWKGLEATEREDREWGPIVVGTVVLHVMVKETKLKLQTLSALKIGGRGREKSRKHRRRRIETVTLCRCLLIFCTHFTSSKWKRCWNLKEGASVRV